MEKIPYNKPYVSGRELHNIAHAYVENHLSGDGPFTKQCNAWIEGITGAPKALLTHSCTAALEMAAILIDIQPGDEVIMPSFTFVSTANAFVLRGGVPVFVDVRADTLNMDEQAIEAAITPRTRAIAPVHYAGVGCDMPAIMAIAEKHGLYVVEDAAQCLMSSYAGKHLGNWGHIGALSFHETKNIQCGEGGAILVNDPKLIENAEIIWQKGTDRRRFLRGEVDKYTWQMLGSSYLPSELNAAFLRAQLDDAERVTAERCRLWSRYHEAFAGLEHDKLLRRPIVPHGQQHNGHIYYVLLNDVPSRDGLLQHLNGQGINAVFHYMPLHLAPMGLRIGRAVGSMHHTNTLAARLVRMPMWVGLSDAQQTRIIDSVSTFLRG